MTAPHTPREKETTEGSWDELQVLGNRLDNREVKSKIIDKLTNENTISQS